MFGKDRSDAWSKRFGSSKRVSSRNSGLKERDRVKRDVERVEEVCSVEEVVNFESRNESSSIASLIEEKREGGG